jgi:hypothetical protein
MKNLVKIVGLSVIASGMLFASPNTDYSELSKVINISNSLIMDNNFVKAGVSDDGTFGVGGTKKPGFQLDPWGDGNYTAIVDSLDGVDTNSTPDYLTPGSPFEGFSLKFDIEGNVTIYKENNNGSRRALQGKGGLACFIFIQSGTPWHSLPPSWVKT